MSNAYPVVEFRQYGSSGAADRLILFAAPAEAIQRWAGIPSKGWHVRLLYQRWVQPSRQNELVTFWNHASQGGESGNDFILGPTALTVAIREDIRLTDGKITLDHTPLISGTEPPHEQLQVVSRTVLPQLIQRLGEENGSHVQRVADTPGLELPDSGNDYVYESALQIAQMAADPEGFISNNKIQEAELTQLVASLESLTRPALVVDGQHRLYGAARADSQIWLPVVAIPNCRWTEQIYQFVVINEKAEKVESSLLTDIFGSSLTPSEQGQLRERLQRAQVQIEPRIAAVVASRDPESPFHEIVRIKLQTPMPGGAKPFVTEATIRALVDGGRANPGWRSDTAFYEWFVKPTYPRQVDWDHYTDGCWRRYWYLFWSAVAGFYNEQASRELRPDEIEALVADGVPSDQLLWNNVQQSNLTKAVTMRLMQRLFMEEAVRRVRKIEGIRDLLVEEFGPEAAEEKIHNRIVERAIKEDTQEFVADLKTWFLESGVPVRVFTKKWIGSLDDSEGTRALWEELNKAYSLTQDQERYHARNSAIFAVGED